MKELASKLNRRITIKHRVLTDQDGATSERWEPVCTVWCGVNCSSFRRFLYGDSVNYENTTLFTIRYRTGITPDMRVYYGDKPYAIIGIVDPNECHRELHITATTDLEVTSS